MTGRWSDLLVMATGRVAMGVQFQSIGALGPVLVGTIAPDYAALGTLIGAYLLPGILLAIPMGWLMARIGDRRMLLGGLLLMGVGAGLLALADGFAFALLARLVAGAGASLLSLVGTKMVLDRFADASLTLALGVMLAAWPLGLGAALVALPAFSDDGAWRWGVAASGAMAWASAALVAALLPRDPPREHGVGLPRLGLKRGEWGPLLAAGAVWGFYNAAFAVALGFAPALLVALGRDAATAGAIASLIGWAILPLLPFGGWIAARTGRPTAMMVLCLLGMAIALVCAARGIAPGLSLALVGLLAAPPASLVMAMAGKVLSPDSRGFGMGVFYTQFYASLALLPALAGWTRDLTGDPGAPLITGVAFIAVSLGALAVYRSAMREQA